MDEENKKSNETSNAVEKMIKAIGKIINSCFKSIKTFIKWIGSALAGFMPFIMIGLAVIVVTLIVISIISLILSAFYDKVLGLMTSIGGVTGDKFYGTRYVYYDEQYTTIDLKNKYLEFTYNIVKDVNDTTSYNINIDYTKNYLESSQVSNICMSFVTALSEQKEYINVVNIIDYTKQIDHYGFKAEESDIVIKSLAKSTLSYFNDGTEEDDLIYQFNESYKKSKFDYMKNVCAKILIKDYIVNSDETASDIPKKNYVGFVYMPKQEVIFKETSFVFGIEKDKKVYVKGNYKSQTLHEEIASDTADHTWYNGESMEKSFKCNLNEYIFTEFKAIDTTNLNYLSDGKTLFDICKDGKYNIFFNDIEDKINVTELMGNINTTNYFYLTLNSDTPYNMAESYVEYE